METPAHDDWPIGTHLITPRRGFMHHGVYAGQGRVIHYAGFDRFFRRGPVEEVDLARFSRGRAVTAVVHPAPAFAGEAAVSRARKRLGEDGYRLWTNNCEHFVHWCLHGSPRSPQVERIAGGLRKAWPRTRTALATPH